MKPRALALAAIFGAFAFAYFLAALLRAVTATLAPVFSAELALTAADLGLLAGAYFFGFAALQLPLGHALDRHGPRRTLLALLAVAVLGCAAFALARGLTGLVAARALIGVGVGATLMAPLTCYRHLLGPAGQLRANSWMLMTGSVGMVASTLPVQWLLPLVGWRGLFWLLAAALGAAMLAIAAAVPRELPQQSAAEAQREAGSYAAVLRHPLFVRMAPLAFFVYGGLVAVQALWAGPWLTRVSGYSALQSAEGLFAINLSMWAAFLLWGAALPRLACKGFGALRLMTWGLPLPLAVLALNLALGAAAGAAHWALWCVGCTFVTVSQPALAAAFPAAAAGRALSAFNLMIFAGVFCIQWGIGVLIDLALAAGLAEADAHRAAFGAYGAGSLLAYLWFLRRGGAATDDTADNRAARPT